MEKLTKDNKLNIEIRWASGRAVALSSIEFSVDDQGCRTTRLRETKIHEGDVDTLNQVLADPKIRRVFVLTLSRSLLQGDLKITQRNAAHWFIKKAVDLDKEVRRQRVVGLKG